jgi:hypothetical protein
MNGIFISYRREDTEWVSGLIHERLAAHFGSDAIFTDIDSIPLGVNFKKYIDKQVGECDIFLAVIGEKWLSVTDEGGRPRLQQQTDFVRLEIESALKRDIPVIPLLVGKVAIPSADELPESLRELALRNGTWIRPKPTFDSDVGRLIRSIEKHLGVQPKEEKKSQHDADEIHKYEEEKYAFENVTEHELRAHLRHAGGRVEDGILDQPHITVDLSSLSHKDKDVHYLPVELYPTVSVLLEDVYLRLKDHVPPYTYGTHWILRHKKSGKVIEDKKLKFRDSSGSRVVDNRPLADEDIIAGTQLIALASTDHDGVDM